MTNQPTLQRDCVTIRDYSTPLQHAVATAAAAWQGFIALPDDQKQLYAAQDMQSGTGYEQKLKGERESNDRKENFDFTAASLQEFADVQHSKAAAVFLQAAADLGVLLRHEIAEFGKEIEQQLSQQGFAVIADRSRNNYFIRFLHYPPAPLNTVIGEPHPDHSGFTFHLYESTDGCRALRLSDRTWQSLPVAHDKMVAFGGMQLQLATKGAVKALTHDIIATAETSKHGRIAIVCFTSLDSVPRYSRKQFGRVQDMPIGFNYDTSYKEFTAYFDER